MRGKPRRTERVVGAVVLALTAFIVGSFLLTGGLFGEAVGRWPVLTAVKNAFGLSERPLFVAAAENMVKPPPPHEARTAAAMLPAPSEVWKRTAVTPVRVDPTAPEWAALQTIDADLARVAAEYGAAWAYLGTYGNGERTLAVVIVDAGSPPSAFGLSRVAQKEKEAQRLALGRGGWFSEKANAAGFWAGRYYTQVIGQFSYDGGSTPSGPAVAGSESGSPAAPAVKTPGTVEQIARMAAALQVNYGGPFWAESVLPAEGRVEDSLLYAKKNGLSIDALSDCWIADYPEGVRLAVMQPAAPEKVIAALRSRFEESPALGAAIRSRSASEPVNRAATVRERNTAGGAITPQEHSDPRRPLDARDVRLAAEEDESAGSAAQETGDASTPESAPRDLIASLGPEAVAGRIGDQNVVATIAGPYVFVAIGSRPESVVAVASAARQHAAGLAPAHASGATAAAAARAQPPGSGQARFAELEGGDVEAPTRSERFTDNLYEKIDGREGQFRAFGFVELRFAQYQDTRQRSTFDVYIYDMGQPNNAMGIYTAEKSEGAERLDIGGEAYISGQNVYYYKGKYYVNVLGPAEGGGSAAEISKKIAIAIAETIADSGGRLWADTALPKENRAGSLRYQATSALAHDFLERFFFAKYQVDGIDFEMFAHKAPSAADAAELFSKYAAATAKYETVVSREKTDGGETLVSDSLGTFTVAFHKGVYFAGVSNCRKNQDLAVRQAAVLRGRLNAKDPGEPAPPKTEAPQESEGGGDHGY